MDKNTQTPATDDTAVVAPEVTEEVVVETEAPVATEEAVITEDTTEEVVA